MNEEVPLEQLEKDYAQIICYPKYETEEFSERLAQMRELKITSLSFTGEKTVNNIRVLGKGYVGIVVLAYTSEIKTAVKIRRTDADRTGMEHEAEMLRIANSINIGPKLLRYTDDFLSMEFIDGMLLPKWLESLEQKRNSRERIRKVLTQILEQAWHLDEIGLDHGELSNCPKHIIVDKQDQVCLVDFETASVKRRVSNVTSVCQYLFMEGKAAKLINKELEQIDKSELVATLKFYKANRTRNSFSDILEKCRLLD